VKKDICGLLLSANFVQKKYDDVVADDGVVVKRREESKN
jgi:hypothetical protein